MHMLTSFQVASDETGRQLKDSYLTTTRIVNMALRATLNELPEKGEPLSWEKNPMSRKLSSKQFRNSLLEQFLEFIYSSSPQMQNKNVTTLKKFRPCLRS